MTWEIGLLLGVLVVALVLFSWERISTDVVALGVLVVLAITGLLPRKQAFLGFGSDTLIMLAGLLVLTAALQRTGVVELLGRLVLRRTKGKPDLLLGVIMVAAAGISAFISNTASTAFFLPVVFGIASKARISPSKLLMPLAFATILASSVTLVSTSTNVIVSGWLASRGQQPMGMFELSPVGVPIVLVGLIYLYFARRWIPERVSPKELTEQFGLRPFLSEVVVTRNSPLIGRQLADSKMGEELGLHVLGIVRRKHEYLEPRAETVLEAADVLLVEATEEDLLKIKNAGSLEIKADVRLSDPDLAKTDTALVEVLVLPGSPLRGRTLKGCRFRERYGLQVLGINRHGVNVVRKISLMPLKLGDVLLVQGRRENILRARDQNAFQILTPIEPMLERIPRRRHAPLAITIFAGVLGAVTWGWLSLPLAVTLGVLLIFVTGCLKPAEAYAAVEWKVLVLVGCMLGLGEAMTATGAAQYLAKLITASGLASPVALLTAFFWLTVLLTQPMSNQAAAIVVLPLAFETALQTGLNPRTFAMMIAVAGSCSYLTPLEPSCLFVYGPGRYKFADFFKIGSPLTLVIYVVAILIVPRAWPP